MIDAETGSNGTTGPTIETLGDAERPEPMPACGTCPKAMWYRTSRHLRAFCREIRLITWEDGERNPILQCDGREAGLLALDDTER